jgi:hypothetical protein
MKTNTISQRNACRIMRVMIRIDEQIGYAYRDGRIEDAKNLSKLFGALVTLQFGPYYFQEM